MTIKNKIFTIILFSFLPFLSFTQSADLVLTGIMDFTVPSGGNDGKAIHVTATDTIADLSVYGIGVANNGGGTDGQEYTFDPISVLPGEDILVARSIPSMTSYFDTCFTEFDHVLQASSSIGQNGDDAIELFFNGTVIETFGYLDVDGTGECWEYTDSWVYKDTSVTDTCAGGGWIFGGVDCTDGSTTSYSSNCPYPLCPLPPTAGCTDPFALNYNPLATFNDGSCLYSGCMDPTALNYCSSCNVSDSLSCIYPACNAVGLNEDFESNNLNTNGWITYAGTEANAVLTSSNAISGSVSLQFSGGTANWSNWSNPFSELGAFSNSTHVSSSIICLDLSSASSTVNLNVLVYPTGNSTTYPYSWYRLKVNDTVVADINGNTAYTRQYSNSTSLSGNAGVISSPTNLIYDLSIYSGDSSVSVSIESSCKWTDDIVLVDNFNVFNVDPCSYFSLSSIITDPTCNQFSDGFAIVVPTNDSLYTDTYSYLWSNGQTSDTAVNLASGSYSCIVSGNTFGCIDTINIVLEDPDAISVQSVIVDASSSTSTNGSVDLTVSGGTPCLPDSSYSFLWSTGDTTEDVSGLMTGPVSCIITDCNGCVYSWSGFVYIGIVSGCTDPLAYNFNPIANTDDGSCVYAGCTDSLALNYDSLATVDDGSCIYTSSPIFFSEYAEGSSNNKYFEVYNPTSDTVDLSLYAYPNVGNAPTTPGMYEYWNDFDAGAVILPNDVYVVAHPSADPTILTEADETFTYLSNGDDGFGLVYGDQTTYQVIDWLGDWNGDPGSGWDVAGVPNATKDHTLVRKCDVTSGDTSWANSAGTDSLNSQWLVYPQNTWTYLGVHVSPCNFVYGCTDSTALNYDSLATIDDGSCLYDVFGCTDSTATNFNSLASIDDGSCFYFNVDLSLQGIIDFTVPSGGSDGKAIHLVATDSIADLSVYGIGIANNGGGTDSIEYVFPAMSVNTGESILLYADSSAMASYFDACFTEFDHILQANSSISQNGDDAVELFKIISSSALPVAHNINAGNFYFTPSALTINAGDTVVWLNNGGFHNVNFVNSTITGLSFNNPESFITTPTSGPILDIHVFNISGSYNYDCAVGSHASNGMVGSLNVINNTTYTSVVVETFGDINVDGTGTPWEYMDSWAYKDASGSVTFSGGNWIFGGVNCTDGSTTTYNSSCPYPLCPPPLNSGCTDPNASNYDSLATVDDGSCIYTSSSIFFSEYAEGSSNNKYFEVYNPTADTVDLSLYAYPNVGNAPTTPGMYEYWNDFDAGAVVLPNDVYVVAHPSADPTILAQADETHMYLSNGDDGYGLVFGDQTSYVVIDWLGDWNGDPGSGWEVAGVPNATQNHTLVRKCDVTSGDTSWTNAAGTDSLNSQWIVYPQNTWTYLGYHISPCNTGVLGCTDSTALNYDSLATVDDGSCLYPVYGCTDSTALNYNPLATVDDGTCNYTIQSMANLFFSEYAEGSSHNKYFEVYNPTSDTVDLSNYAYPNSNNTPSVLGVYDYWNDFDAGAVVLPNDVYVVAHGSADASILAEADETHNYLSNGDDGYGLVYGDQTSYIVIDWLGNWDGDPGSGWDVAGVTNGTKDHTLVRKCTVTGGNTDWTTSAGTDSLNSEWLVYPQNTWTYLGYHEDSCSNCVDSSFINITSCDDSVQWNEVWYNSSGVYYSSSNLNSFSLEFDGIDDFVEVVDDSTIQVYEFTAIMDVFVDNIGPDMALLTKLDDNATNEQFYCGIRNGNLRFGVKVGSNCLPNNSWQVYTSSFTLNANQWYNLTYQYDMDKLKLYVDGIFTEEYDLVNDGPIDDCLGGSLKIGKNWNGDPEFYDGKIDNVQFWNYSLSASEIASYSLNIPTGNETGLSGFWNFDEGIGNTLLDQTVNNNDGIINGANYSNDVRYQSYNFESVNGCDSVAVLNLTLINVDSSFTNITTCDSIEWNGIWYDSSGVYYSSSGNSNSFSLEFDGLNDFVEVSDNSTLQVDEFTAIIDVFVESIGAEMALFTKLEDNANNEQFYCGINTSGNLHFAVKIGSNCLAGQGWQSYTSTFTLNSNQWYNLAYQYDMDKLKLFVDGVFIEEFDVINDGPIDNCIGGSLRFGKNWNGGPNFFNGKLDNVQFWNFDLTPSEIATYSSCNPIGNETGLAGYWNFEEGSGNTVFDLTSNANNGTINGSIYSSDVVSQNCSFINSNINGCDSVAVLNLTIINCEGCTDSLALNYDSLATIDDGSCIYCVYGCMDSTAFNYDSLATCDDGSCSYDVFGCTDSTALNYDSLATIDDGSCIYCVYGCTDPTAFNYDSLATCDDGSCIPLIYGCTDSTAVNYYPGANTDDGSCIYAGCTDPNAINYNPIASIDDGSCLYMNCTDPSPTGLALDWVTDTKAGISWDNMNDSSCMVWKYYVRYREVGAPSWTTKSAGVGNGLCNFGLNTTTKTLQNLTSGTTYEYKMKAFYCGGTESNYSPPSQFTTAADCPPMTNLTATTFNGNQSKVRFDWDTTGAYVFARVALRVDTLGANWQTAGGFGVYYPTLQVNKFGLQSGESYRAQGRTFCDSNITSYRSWWTSPIFWTQPGSIRMGGGTTITNLAVYPNPTKDIFNVSFVSDEIQTLGIRVLNIVGEVVYTETLDQFIGEYTKQISIGYNARGVYFLEITDNQGTINKKIILQ